MNSDTKELLKKSFSNIYVGLGFLSTISTFIPVMAFLKLYLLIVGIILIAIGMFLAASSAIEQKNQQLKQLENKYEKQIEILGAETKQMLEELRFTKNEEILSLRDEKDAEIATLNRHITELSRKPYSEELRRTAEQVLNNQMTLQGRLAIRHLMIHEPIEVGRGFGVPLPQDQLHAQLAIAKDSGIVQHKEEGTGLRRTYWIINPRFRPVLEDVLYSSVNQV